MPFRLQCRMQKGQKTGTELETGRSQRQPSMAQTRWEEKVLKPALEIAPERKEVFTTLSGVPVERLYTPSDLADFDYARDLGDPGEYPFTRGIHSTMYRGRVWTMRQFSGFGSPQDTNQRLHYLLKQGQTGLSIAFDLPTLMGYDSDHVLAEGEVGKCGVAVSSLADMETLLAGLPLERITTSMTINSPAAIIWAMTWPWQKRAGPSSRRSQEQHRMTFSRSTSPKRSTFFRPSRRCASSWTLLCMAHGKSPAGMPSPLAATTFVRQDRPRCRNSPSPCGT